MIKKKGVDIRKKIAKSSSSLFTSPKSYKVSVICQNLILFPLQFTFLDTTFTPIFSLILMKNTQPQNQHIIQLFFLERIFNEEKCNFL